MKKHLSCLLSMLALSAMALPATAATVIYTGVVESSTSALFTLIPPGTPVGGPIEYDDIAVAGGLVGIDDILAIDVNVGGFCFTTGADAMGCPLGGAYVPITSIDAAAITFASGLPTGGTLDVTAFSPSFGVAIPIAFDLTAGTFFADAGALGVATGTFSPVPVPAAAWLFGSALLGLFGLRRRNA